MNIPQARWKPMKLLCGSEALLDPESSIGAYRCTTCDRVVGSVGMPKECKILYDMQEVVTKLQGK